MISQDALDDAIGGLRGWRSAGEAYANRGGSLTRLDYQVDAALDEIAYLRADPEFDDMDELAEDRPDAERLRWAMDGIRTEANDDIMGADLRTVLSYLEEPSLFA